MAKKVKQFRFYNSTDTSKNYPATITFQRLQSGSIFSDYLPILQLGIQALPGTKFYVNNSNLVDPIIIGSTGIYELDLLGETEISALSFDSNSLQAINDTNNACLIVDIIYDDRGGTA